MSTRRRAATTRSVIIGGVPVGALLSQTPVAAHSGHGASATDSGLLHLLLSLHHLGALVAVGILATAVGLLTVTVGLRRMALVLGAILSGAGLAILLGL